MKLNPDQIQDPKQLGSDEMFELLVYCGESHHPAVSHPPRARVGRLERSIGSTVPHHLKHPPTTATPYTRLLWSWSWSWYD